MSHGISKPLSVCLTFIFSVYMFPLFKFSGVKCMGELLSQGNYLSIVDLVVSRVLARKSFSQNSLLLKRIFSNIYKVIKCSKILIQVDIKREWRFSCTKINARLNNMADMGWNPVWNVPFIHRIDNPAMSNQ